MYGKCFAILFQYRMYEETSHIIFYCKLLFIHKMNQKNKVYCDKNCAYIHIHLSMYDITKHTAQKRQRERKKRENTIQRFHFITKDFLCFYVHSLILLLLRYLLYNIIVFCGTCTHIIHNIYGYRNVNKMTAISET